MEILSQLRKVAFFLGVWYLLMGLGIPTVAAEAAVQAGFPCAGHDCGCSTAEGCRRHCCCFPAAATASRQSEPESRNVSYLAQARCQGEEPGGPVGASPRLGSHLPIEIAVLPRESSSGRVSPAAGSTRRVVPADPPDKIPI